MPVAMPWLMTTDPTIMMVNSRKLIKIVPAAKPTHKSALIQRWKSNAWQLFHPLSTVMVGALVCVACSSVHTKTPEGVPVSMNEQEFAAYVEHVFRHHNNVVNESLFVTPSVLAAGDDPVVSAEMKMHHACQPLNEVASLSATGEGSDFWLQMKLADAVPECEAATRDLEKALSQEKR